MALKHQIVLCLFFILIAFGLKGAMWGTLKQNTFDYGFHLAKANGSNWDNNKHSQQTFQEYPNFWHLLSSPFSQSNTMYYIFSFVFFALAFTILIYWKTKSELTAWFVFAASNLIWRLDYYATFPQYLTMVFFLIALINKNLLVRLVLLFLALLTHHAGFFLLLAWYLIEFIVQNFDELIKQFKTFMPFFVVFDRRENILDTGKFGLSTASIIQVAIFFVFEFNFFYVILSFLGFIKEKGLLVFSFILFFLGFFETRVMWVFYLTGLIGLIQCHSMLSDKNKHKLFLLTLITLAVNLVSFVYLNQRPSA